MSRGVWAGEGAWAGLRLGRERERERVRRVDVVVAVRGCWFGRVGSARGAGTTMREIFRAARCWFGSEGGSLIVD